MITYGRSQYHFYCFDSKKEQEDYRVLHIELKAIYLDKRKTYVPVVLETIENCVWSIGLRHVDIHREVKMVDFAGKLPGPVRTILLPAGKTCFEILRVCLPLKPGDGSDRMLCETPRLIGADSATGDKIIKLLNMCKYQRPSWRIIDLAVLPGSTEGLAKIGLETILAKQMRVSLGLANPIAHKPEFIGV